MSSVKTLDSLKRKEYNLTIDDLHKMVEYYFHHVANIEGGIDIAVPYPQEGVALKVTVQN